MSAETLLPCPFCGGTNTDPEGWMQTDINGGVSQGPTCEDCDAAAASVAAWNRRTPQPDALPGDMRERVVAAVAANVHVGDGQTVINGPALADAILSLIQSERGN